MAHTLGQRFLNGDGRAIAEVRAWAASVVRFGGWRFPDPEAITQEVLLKLVEIGRAEGFEEEERFRRLVHAVARNTCIDTYRRERLRRRHEACEPAGEAGTGDPEEDLASRERVALFTRVFRMLSEDCQRLLRWIYSEGLSAAEVGSRLGLTANNVRVRVHRCVERARFLARSGSEAGSGGSR